MIKFRFTKAFWLAFAAAILAGSGVASANPIQLSAVVQPSPTQITVNWPSFGSSGYAVYRSTTIGGYAGGGGSWGTPVANLGSSATSYTDTSVAAGVGYEYDVSPVGVTGSDGYIYAGIALPLVDYRGKIVLMVDSAFLQNLAFEINRLQRDLTGDGWLVIRHDVSRTNTPPGIKAIIEGDYNADPTNVAAVLLLGHIPVPHSGWLDPDGHGPRPGPTDTYYGDMHGTWTDTQNFTPVNPLPYLWWTNVAGDGKFDQTTLPADVDLQVGRIDFYDLPDFEPLYESDLLRRYLNKDHAFRQGAFSVSNQGATMTSITGDYCMGQFFGTNAPFEIPAGDYFSQTASSSYLWFTKGTGGGEYDYSAGMGSTTNFAASSGVNVVFNAWFASYFWEWDVENSFLRAPLAAQGYSLVNLWSDSPVWVLHHMALGKTIGYSARVSQNNNGYYNLYGDATANSATSYRRGVHMSLMGDPTLRMHVATPPATLLSGETNGQVYLSWSAAPQAGLLGYNIYRATSPAGPFTNLNSAYLSGTTFTDSNPPAGPWNYQVKAVRLETASGSGTYINASQGTFDQQAPRVLYVAGTMATQVTVVFDKPLDPASSQRAGNYQLSGGVTVNSAALQSDQHTVVLGTSAQSDGITYTLTANNVADLSTPPNLTSSAQASYAFSIIPEYASDTNTIALWHLDGNGADASGNGYTLTLNGAAAFATNSPVGATRQCLRVVNVGDSATVNVPANVILPQPGKPFTIEARIFVNAWKSYSIANSDLVAADQGYQAFFGYSQGIWDLPAAGKFAVADATLMTNETAEMYLPMGTWEQIAVVFDGTNNNYVYINNVLRAGPVAATPNYGNTAPFVVTLGNFDGYIDEVRLSSVARNFVFQGSAPTNIVASGASINQIVLGWSDVPGETGFSVERYSGGIGGFVQIATTPAGVTSYSDTNVVSGGTYTYRVRAFNATDISAYSPQAGATAVLVSSAPVIVNQPVSATNTASTTASFNVTAVGANLNYQWYKNGAAIAGAGAATLTLPFVTDANAGNYSVVVSNSLGSVTSTTAVLTVFDLPTITSQPADVTINAGQNATFSVSAAGESPLTCQWQFNGASIAWGTNGSLIVTNASAANAGNYRVIVSNVAGTVTSSTAVLTVVGSVPSITTQPASQTAGQSAAAYSTFYVVASGMGLNYQWYFNSTPLPSGTGSSLNVRDSLADGGTYQVVVSNIDGAATSASANLNVIALPIAAGLASQTNIAGTTATFAINTNGTPATIRWYHGITISPATLVSGQNNPACSFTANDASAGTYIVTVSNILGSLASASANLTVIDPPAIVTALTNLAVNQGVNAALYTKATSGASSLITNVWQFSPDNNNDYTSVYTNAPVSSGTLVSYTVVNPQATNQGWYQVVVATGAASVTNGPVFMTVRLKPVITTQLATPTGPACNVGALDTYTIGATGYAPLSYYWKVNGVTTESSGNSITLGITNNVTSNLTFEVSVIVSNITGALAGSQTSVFYVNKPPVITTRLPGTASVLAGDSYEYFVVVGQGYPINPTNLTYYWKFNGNPIGSSTTNAYTVEQNMGGYLGAVAANAGTYSVTVSNFAGTATSSSVLSVTRDIYAPTITPLSPIEIPGLGYWVTNVNVATASGVAGDNAQVTNVICTLNSTNPVLVTPGLPNNWTTWSANLNGLLVPGTNTVVVQGVDFSGNVTPITANNTRKIVFYVTNNVPVTLTGAGNVYGTAMPGTTNPTPATLSLPLAIGLQYSLTATDYYGSGQVFSNWLVFPSGQAGQGTASVTNESPTLRFFATTNGAGAPLAVEGDFASTPFNPNIAGTYNGLFYEGAPDGVQLPSAGFVTLTIDSNGVAVPLLYNVNGVLAPGAHPLFNVSGQAQFTIVRNLPLHNLLVTLQADLTGASQTVTGIVAEAEGAWIAYLTADRNIFSTNNPTPNAGAYSFVIPGVNDPTLGPAGNSYAYLTLATSGRFTISGMLGDGTPEAEEYPGNIYPSKDGLVPLYIRTAHGNVPDGAVIGWLDFTNHPGSGGFTNLAATLVWEQQGNGKAPYHLGFTNVYSSADTPPTLVGSGYAPPTAGHDIANFTTTTITLEGGDLPVPVVTPFTLNPTTDVVKFTGGNSVGVVLTMAPGIGGFIGSFLDSNNMGTNSASSRKVTFSGGILQNPANPFGVTGWGEFLDINTNTVPFTTNVGSVTIP